ncbi:MAG TPA: hypothetical protein VFY37_04280, partial [Solirubrobacterales bacterium]|nr:hypothetical protein [Solirubrobacterales bacterium]
MRGAGGRSTGGRSHPAFRTLTATLPGGMVVAAFASAAATPAGDSARDVDAATTGMRSELRKTVPITRRPGSAPRIVLSLGAGKIPRLDAGDRLEVSSEVQVTVDCTVREPRCAGRPYRFDPRVIVWLKLANRRGLGGGRTLARRKLSCGQQEPLRQHHCPVVFDSVFARVGDGFPCRPGGCYLNLAVSAHSPKAEGGERIVIGASKPSGRIKQGKGHVSIVRVSPEAHTEWLSKDRAERNSLRLRPRKKVVLSQKVQGLERGEVISAVGTLRSDVRHLGHSALVGAELIAARGPRASSPSKLVRRSVSQEGVLSSINGTNCTPLDSPCLT